MSTLHGYAQDDIAAIARKAIDDLSALLRGHGSAEARLAALDALYLKASHIERIALREAAFQFVCGGRL